MGPLEPAIPDPVMLARLLRELDTPMDQHVAMIEAVDWANEQRFERELVEEHERFLFASHDDKSDDDF
jgi:hypothetical protein